MSLACNATTRRHLNGSVEGRPGPGEQETAVAEGFGRHAASVEDDTRSHPECHFGSFEHAPT